MPAPSSKTNSCKISKIAAKCEALHKKREEEDQALEAKIAAKQKCIEERIAEEKRAAKEKKKKEAVRKAKFDRRARSLAEKQRQEAVANERRKGKQKAVEESDELEEGSKDESEREPGLSIPKKRRIQEMVSKVNKQKN